jgi:micrococcal nuclease
VTNKTIWTVPADVLRVVDGDTLEVNLDLGWHITLKTKVRLAGVNCPEMNTEAGRAARDFVADLIFNDRVIPRVMVHSHSLDKYGRVLGQVMIPSAPGGAYFDSLSKALLDHGHATVME